MSVKENLAEVRNEINEILKSKGREKDDVTLIAVTKTIDEKYMLEAIEDGITDIGENKVQEIERKYNDLGPIVNYHMIGSLQSNKVKDVIDKVCLIHSLDRKSLLKEINKRGRQEDKVINCLIQMNISKEETKSGVYEEDLEEFLELVENYEYVRVQGLMTMAPHADNPEDIRWVFTKMKEIFDSLSEREFKNIEMKYLSMGMSNDYNIAIEEGSNMVRVGTKIFGKRDYSK